LGCGPDRGDRHPASPQFRGSFLMESRHGCQPGFDSPRLPLLKL
jgi:hypothetical protein